jgi:pyridoxamine 5'-phosphate oxidase
MSVESLRPSEPPFGRLTEASLTADPMDLFRQWFEQARTSLRASGAMRYPDAVIFSTLTEDGMPDGRVVLLKELDPDAFVIYTNLESSKGRAVKAHPKAALTFYWDGLGRQVRVRGEVEQVADARADAYFGSRPRESRIGAWASAQSREIADRAELEAQVRAVEERFAGADVPRPEHWSGLRVIPREIEFWQEGEHRLHDRFRYQRAGEGSWSWSWSRLSP